MENGYHNTTIAEIAARAEFGVGTLYQFFSSKQSLCAEVILQNFGAYYDVLKAEIDKGETWRDKLRTLMSFYLNVGVENSTDFLLMIRELFYTPGSQTSSELVNRFFGFQKELLEYMKEILGEAAQETADFDIDFRAMSVFSLLNGIYDYSTMGLLTKAPQDYVEDIIDWLGR